MSWIVETPWPSLTLGIVLEIALAIALVRTGRAMIIGVMVLVLAVIAELVILERVVVTETEEVEDALDQIAHSVEANDMRAVLASFSPKCPRLNEVRSQLSRVDVRSASVGGDLKIRFNRLAVPPSATTFFTGHVQAHDKRGEIPYEHMIRKFKVTLQKEGDRWVIADFSDADPRNDRQ